MLEATPFFIPDGDRFIPTELSLGYWGPRTLNGRVIGGLLGFELERVFGEPDFVPARFTVDLFRLSPFAPVGIETRLLRRGGRLKLAEADFICQGAVIARASCQFLRGSESPPNPTWQTPAWRAPRPQQAEAAKDGPARNWEVRPIAPEHQRQGRVFTLPPGSGPGNPPVLGPLAPIENRQAWVRETRPLVGGFPHTPFSRLAVAADFASPLANSSAWGIDYVNSDFTVYVHRLPTSEWIGFELVSHLSRRGVAVGECWVHDEHGPLGSINAAAIAQTQRAPAAPTARQTAEGDGVSA